MLAGRPLRVADYDNGNYRLLKLERTRRFNLFRNMRNTDKVENYVKGLVENDKGINLPKSVQEKQIRKYKDAIYDMFLDGTTDHKKFTSLSLEDIDHYLQTRPNYDEPVKSKKKSNKKVSFHSSVDTLEENRRNAIQAANKKVQEARQKTEATQQELKEAQAFIDTLLIENRALRKKLEQFTTPDTQPIPTISPASSKDTPSGHSESDEPTSNKRQKTG